VPPQSGGLLARLDALVALVADRHGRALLPDGRLAAAEARMAVRAVGLARAGGRGRTVVERDAVELLRAVAEAVGLVRVRGDRLEATSLRHAWGQIDEGLRAGLTFAAWCQQVTLTGYAQPPGGPPSGAPVAPLEPSPPERFRRNGTDSSRVVEVRRGRHPRTGEEGGIG
jgi:hypothetical protein